MFSLYIFTSRPDFAMATTDTQQTSMDDVTSNPPRIQISRSHILSMVPLVDWLKNESLTP